MVYTLILWPLAILMVYIISSVIKWSLRIDERIGFSIALFILVMMLAMFGGAVLYFSHKSLSTLEQAALLNLAVMTVGLLAVFFNFLTVAKDRASALVLHFREIVIVLALLNEFFMGWAFALISGTVNAHNVIAVLNSYWFTIPMGSEMLLTLFLLRRSVNANFIPVLCAQAVIMLFTPTALSFFANGNPAIYAGSAVMTLLFIYCYDMLYRNRRIYRIQLHYLLALLGTYSLMMFSTYFWQIYRNETLLAVSLIVEMLLFFQAIVLDFSKGAKLDWHGRPYTVFALLSLIFIAEFFMGASLDIAYYGHSFINTMGLVPLMGSLPSFLSRALFDAVDYISSVTLSSWFLIMMGAEMGALVVMRIREVHSFETKIRLTFVIAAYAIYSTLLPYFIIPANRLPYTPFIGWSMGVGTAGAVAPATIVAIVLTYVISAILSLLFGGRQVCSVFCTAALMYQGTFYDSLKTFNKSSKTAMKITTNRAHKIHYYISSIIWSSIIGAAVLSYLNSLHFLNAEIYGMDPVFFAYSFYFGVLWYITFLAIPFLGTYTCLTSGWCHWGSFNTLVGRLGFWRLKVRDPYQCVNCKTKDCASACPVGLSAMPGSFIDKGEFRSYRCIGVGDCVEACPVNNIFFYDVRHWLKEKSSTTPGATIAGGRGR
jgi:polyferredoxin